MTSVLYDVQSTDWAPVRGGALEQAVASATSPACFPNADEMLVVALWPDHNLRRVVASPGNSAVRAAISVSIAAGNQRAWSAASGDEVVDVAIASLPEIIRAAIVPSGLQSVRVGAVTHADSPVCLLMWLARTACPTTDDEARHDVTRRAIAEAVGRDRAGAEQTRPQHSSAADEPQSIDNLPELDPLATIATRPEFDAALTNLFSDETGLIVLGLDHVEELARTHTPAGLDAVRRAIAERLTTACRRDDVVARVGEDEFAVLLVDVDRRSAFEISKRLRAAVSEPVAYSGVLIDVSISVGLAHEVGLLDPTELFVTAESAMVDAHEAGGARMLVAC